MKKKVYRELHKDDEEIIMKCTEWEGLKEDVETGNSAEEITKSIIKNMSKKTGRKKKND